MHQHAAADLRYFKWGVARLVLEADPAPDVVPMFVDGTQRVMPEDRGFPRFLPRPGQTVRVRFGDALDYEATFGDLRRRWEALVRREQDRIARKEQEAAGSRSGGWGLGSWTMWKREGNGVPPAPSQLQLQQPQLPGELATDELKHGKEAQEIRIEVSRRLREEILKVRKAMGGFPEPDPSFALAETWRPDESIEAKKYRSRVDGSSINQN